MSLPKLFVAFCALSLVASGASGHPIGEATPSAPVSVLQIEGHRFELIYAGKQFTSRDSAEARLLLRAPELARESGGERFLLEQMPDEQPGQGEYSCFGRFAVHWPLQQTGARALRGASESRDMILKPLRP